MTRLTTILSALLLSLCLSGLSQAAPGGRGGPRGPQAGPGAGGPGGQGGQGGQRGPGRRGPRGPQAGPGAGAGKIFDRLDADKDGKISAAEAQAAGPRAAQIMAADSDGDGFVTQAELRAHAQAQHVTQTFTRLDKDNDGFLDAAEMGRAAQRLLQADKDGDGKVSRQELTDFVAAQAQAAQQRQAGAQAIVAAFRSADSDSNGKLSAGEWPTTAAATHAAVDADSDGQVTGREVMAYVRANNGQSPF